MPRLSRLTVRLHLAALLVCVYDLPPCLRPLSCVLLRHRPESSQTVVTYERTQSHQRQSTFFLLLLTLCVSMIATTEALVDRRRRRLVAADIDKAQ